MLADHRAVRRLALVVAGLACVAPVALVASGVAIPNAFSNNTVADATQMNANFAAVKTAIDDNDTRIARIEQGGGGGRVKYHRYFTAPMIASLATNKDASTQALTNGRYDITVGATGRRIFDLALVPAGTLSATRNYTVRIEMEMEVITADSDPIIALGDGTDLVGYQQNDASNGNIGYGVEAADATTPTTATIGVGGGAMSTNGRFSETLLRLTSTQTSFQARRGPDIAPAYGVATRVVNADQALKLSFIGNDVSERYGLYSLVVTITEDGL